MSTFKKSKESRKANSTIGSTIVERAQKYYDAKPQSSSRLTRSSRIQKLRNLKNNSILEDEGPSLSTTNKTHKGFEGGEEQLFKSYQSQ